MAAVAYTSSLAERDHYRAALKEEMEEILQKPGEETNEIREIYRRLGFSGRLLEEVTAQIKKDPQAWVSELMAHELRLAPQAGQKVLKDAAVVGFSAILGSFVPIVPFLLLSVGSAIWASRAWPLSPFSCWEFMKPKSPSGDSFDTGFNSW